MIGHSGDTPREEVEQFLGWLEDAYGYRLSGDDIRAWSEHRRAVCAELAALAYAADVRRRKFWERSAAWLRRGGEGR